ncbi:AAA family ATPase [Kitasatospora sp. NBC_01287]|uniref:RNA ligase family protein n=1 Tax=Kitasatospora sp. NBC_01287 TaxID=2903573 RepID=UPI002254991A|nr:RNA ligase family protein [Kitasatospora sp. NBC_01287]MCX4750273.1 AAA family ATPase [Kitasatospora sp. NBC_01287]
MRVHYPRTPHLPWSPGATADDLRSSELSGLRGREVVVTEKLDGENTTLYRDGLHARSPDSAHHPSRAWVKGLQGRLGPAIPPDWRVCGENLFARHSLAYQELAGYFYGFSVWDERDRCLDWDATVRFLHRGGVPTPRVLWRGVFDERALRALRVDPAREEGFVVRAVEGFARAEFGQRVAKWVRPHHVRTDTHWMHAAVVPNGLGPAAELWAVRSGAAPDLPRLLAALGLPPGPEHEQPAAGVTEAAEAAATRVTEAAEALDLLGRTGDARLAGVLATALHGTRRAWLAPRLAGPLGLPLARRIADLVGLHPALHRPYPDEDRRAGLGSLALAADLGVLHSVARAVLAGRTDGAAGEAREQVDWSALHAQEAGLWGPAPFARLRAGLRAELAGLDAAAADRCWAQARTAWARGRLGTVEEAVAATWRWRSAEFPRLIQLVGPSGSGKSTFAAALPDIDARISLDDLREARGERADQRANQDVLREGLDRLDTALAAGGTVVWDATSLSQQQRSLVHTVAQRRDALLTHAVALVDEAELTARNARRAHPVPAAVLGAQLHRFGPPYPGQAHRTWYLGASGTVEDSDGGLGRSGSDPGSGPGSGPGSTDGTLVGEDDD